MAPLDENNLQGVGIPPSNGTGGMSVEASPVSEPINNGNRGSVFRKTAARAHRLRESPSRGSSSVHSEQETETVSLDSPLKTAAVTETTLHYQLSILWERHARNVTGISWDKFVFLASVAVWFILGVVAIVTTKILATTWQAPPLLLTTQQMILSSTILKIILNLTHSVQPWPSTISTVDVPRKEDVASDAEAPLLNGSTNAKYTKQESSSYDRDFVLAGLFNSLDFLASNSAFHVSAANFVETIKASEPITTTMVALIWRIDQLRPKEAVALLVLITGVLLSTYDNAESSQSDSDENSHTLTAEEEAAEKAAAYLAVRTAFTVMTANICFAFRALCQKKYRSNIELPQINDLNLLWRMQQMGAAALILPSLFAHGGIILDAILLPPTSQQLHYMGLALINGTAFAVYNGASTYVLSHVSVLHHSGLNCLRRMFVTVVTCIVFGISLSPMGIAGILLCFAGFVSFTHIRAVRKFHPPPSIVSTPSFKSGAIELPPESSNSHKISKIKAKDSKV